MISYRLQTVVRVIRKWTGQTFCTANLRRFGQIAKTKAFKCESQLRTLWGRTGAVWHLWYVDLHHTTATALPVLAVQRVPQRGFSDSAHTEEEVKSRVLPATRAPEKGFYALLTKHHTDTSAEKAAALAASHSACSKCWGQMPGVPVEHNDSAMYKMKF